MSQQGLDSPLIAQGEAALTVWLAEEGEPLLHLRRQFWARFQGALEQVLAIGLQLEATHGLHRIGALLEFGHQSGVEAGEFQLGVLPAGVSALALYQSRLP